MNVRVQVTTSLVARRIMIDGVTLPVEPETEVELEPGNHELAWRGFGEDGHDLRIIISDEDGSVLCDVSGAIAGGHGETFGATSFVVGDARTGPRRRSRVRFVVGGPRLGPRRNSRIRTPPPKGR